MKYKICKTLVAIIRTHANSKQKWTPLILKTAKEVNTIETTTLVLVVNSSFEWHKAQITQVDEWNADLWVEHVMKNRP